MKKKVVCILIVVAVLLGIIVNTNFMNSSRNIDTKSEVEDARSVKLYDYTEDVVLKKKMDIKNFIQLYNVPFEKEVEELTYIPFRNVQDENYVGLEKQSDIIIKTIDLEEKYELLFSSWYMAPSGGKNIEDFFDIKINIRVDEDVKKALMNHYNLTSFRMFSPLKTKTVSVKDGCRKNLMGYVYQETRYFIVQKDIGFQYQGVICVPRGILLLESDNIPSF